MSNNLQFGKGSGRNTQCYILRLKEATLYLSYQTVVAIALFDDEGSRSYKREFISRTTNRHLHEMLYDPNRCEEVDEDEMDELINEAIIRSGTSMLQARLRSNKGNVIPFIQKAA